MDGNITFGKFRFALFANIIVPLFRVDNLPSLNRTSEVITNTCEKRIVFAYVRHVILP